MLLSIGSPSRADASCAASSGGLSIPSSDCAPVKKARLINGKAVAPASAPPRVKKVIKAANQIRKALLKRGGGVGLRVAVKTSGCSGYAYALEFADEAVAQDLRLESEGVQLLVDAVSLPMIDGTQLDWVREGLNEGFKFHNPNATAECGCGESFKV